MTTGASYDPLLVVERESLALLDAAARDLTAAVPSCPGWTAADLVHHLGSVQRFHAAHVTRGVTEPPTFEHGPRPGDEQLLRWFAEGVTALLDALRAVDPETPAWNWAPHTPQVAAFWPRRMALEALVHRWDAQGAVGDPMPLDPVAAEDAVDEVLTVHNPADRVEAPVPGRGTALVRCTDSGATWVVEADGARFAARREDASAEPRRGGAVPGSDRPEDALVEGPASQLCLALWRRVPWQPLATGDTELAQALLVDVG